MTQEQKKKINDFICKIKGHNFKITSNQNGYTPNIVFVCTRCGKVDIVKR